LLTELKFSSNKVFIPEKSWAILYGHKVNGEITYKIRAQVDANARPVYFGRGRFLYEYARENFCKKKWML